MSLLRRVIVSYAKGAHNSGRDLIPQELFRAFSPGMLPKNSRSLSFLDISCGTYSTRIKWVTRNKKLVEPVLFFRTLFPVSFSMRSRQTLLPITGVSITGTFLPP